MLRPALLKHADHRLDVRVIRGHPGPDEAERRRQQVVQVHRVALGQQLPAA